MLVACAQEQHRPTTKTRHDFDRSWARKILPVVNAVQAACFSNFGRRLVAGMQRTSLSEGWDEEEAFCNDVHQALCHARLRFKPQPRLERSSLPDTIGCKGRLVSVNAINVCDGEKLPNALGRHAMGRQSSRTPWCRTGRSLSGSPRVERHVFLLLGSRAWTGREECRRLH